MKISLIGPVFPYRGGISHFTTLLANNLSQLGHETQIISFKNQYPDWLYPGESDKDYSESRERVKAEFIINPFNPITWNQTVKKIDEFNPDKVIIPWWVTFWGPSFRKIILALKKKKYKIVLLIHNVLPHESGFIDRFLAKEVLKHADNFIVMNEKEKSKLMELLPNAENIHMVPHPIFKQFKATGEQRSNLLERLNLPQNVNNVLFFGFVRPYKGLSDLIMAMKYVCEKDQNIHLVIAGEFWRDREKYDLQIAELNLQENVHIFDHYIPDDAAAQYFEIADIFVAPYARGTQSGALKTALGFGLPTVVTEPIADTMVRSLSELCYIVPAERPKKLANGIITQLRIRKLPQDQIRDIFLRSWEAMIDALTDDCQVPLF